MGQANIRAKISKDIAYHHTSILRTNLIWMSGYIDVEGIEKDVIHPKLGKIRSPASIRRAFSDFPKLAWFTKRIEVPKCLIIRELNFSNSNNDVIETIGVDELTAHGISLQRLALGFSVKNSKLIPWPEYYGYRTGEGRELNKSAREFGDDPDEWYVSESPIDVATAIEVRVSKSTYKPKLELSPSYLKDIKRMVELCRIKKNVYIPPTWMKEEDARNLARKLGLPAL